MSLYLFLFVVLLFSSSICHCLTFCFIVSFSVLSLSLLYLSCRKDVRYYPAQYEYFCLVSRNGKTMTLRNSCFCPEREIAMFRLRERGGTLRLLPTSLHPHSLSGAVRCHYITIQRIESHETSFTGRYFITLLRVTNHVGQDWRTNGTRHSLLSYVLFFFFIRSVSVKYAVADVS